VLVIIRDTREQDCENGRLDFSGIEEVDKVEDMGLAYGDYTAIINEKSVPIIWERKSKSDLWGTLFSDEYQRFKRELARAKEANVKLILTIEGTYTDIWAGFEYSKFDGQAMMKKLATLYVKYDLEYVFNESRRVMARRIVDCYSAIQRNYST